jgi:fumarate reductase subunit D
MKAKTKNITAIVLGISGLVTSFYIFPVVLNIAGIVLAVQVLHATGNRQGKIALAINVLGILVVLGLVIFLSTLHFMSQDFGF